MSNEYIPDDEVLNDWLGEPMSAEKLEEIRKYREDYDSAYQQALRDKQENEYWMFMVSDYFGTGEGRTVCLMMTQASPRSSDYDRENGDFYTPINTKEERARRNFEEIFGDWHAKGIEFLTREEFFKKYSQYLPQKLVDLEKQLCFLEYHSKLYFNFS
jgi:hypothetical protein